MEKGNIASDFARKAFASAKNYEDVRSEYPEEAVKYFLDKLGVKDDNSRVSSTEARPFTILEVGCGTGKFTRVMAKVLTDKNVRVIASEPLESMYEQFKVFVPGTDIVQCAAECIPLPDASVDVVVAAQSFHWFTNRAALEEIHRVLVPNGTFGVLWKVLDSTTPWAKHVCNHLDVLDRENSLVFPHHEEWKEVVGSLVKSLFSFPQEYIGFEHSLEISSYDQAYQHFASYSVVAGNSEIKKKAFKEFFNELMQMYFIEKSIPCTNIPFTLYMYWFHKEV